MTDKAIEMHVSAADVDMPKEQVEKFIDLVLATNKDKPKQADIKALRNFLADSPEIWKMVGDIGKFAYHRLMDNANVSTPVIESLRTGYKQLQKELSADMDGALERLLIQQIILAWLRLQIVETRTTAVTTGSHSMREGEYWEKRLSAAQRRFLRACEALARVRRLNLPAVQVNIGEQQVNQVGR